MTNKEANRIRACLDCGAPGANLLTDRTDRILRVCDACLRKDDWHRFELRSREPIAEEVPTEFFEGRVELPGGGRPRAVGSRDPHNRAVAGDGGRRVVLVGARHDGRRADV